MPHLFIHARNSVFHSHDHGADYAVAEDALASGVRSAIVMITDDVVRGERSVAIEVSVETASGAQVLRSVVSVCVAPLIINSSVPNVGTAGVAELF